MDPRAILLIIHVYLCYNTRTTTLSVFICVYGSLLFICLPFVLIFTFLSLWSREKRQFSAHAVYERTTLSGETQGYCN